MDTHEHDTPESRFRTTLELADAGMRMMRDNLVRHYPKAGEQEIQEHLNRWLGHRPGAKYGDGPQPPLGQPGELNHE